MSNGKNTPSGSSKFLEVTGLPPPKPEGTVGGDQTPDPGALKQRFEKAKKVLEESILALSNLEGAHPDLVSVSGPTVFEVSRYLASFDDKNISPKRLKLNAVKVATNLAALETVATRATNRLTDAQARADYGKRLTEQLKPKLGELIEKHRAHVPQTKSAANEHGKNARDEIVRRPTGDERSDLDKIKTGLDGLQKILDALTEYDQRWTAVDERFQRVHNASKPAQQTLLDSAQRTAHVAADEAMKTGNSASEALVKLDSYVGEVEDFNKKVAEYAERRGEALAACREAQLYATGKLKTTFVDAAKELDPGKLNFASTSLVVPPAQVKMLEEQERLCLPAAECLKQRDVAFDRGREACDSVPTLRTQLESQLESRLNNIDEQLKTDFGKARKSIDSLIQDCTTILEVAPDVKRVGGLLTEVPELVRPKVSAPLGECIKKANRNFISLNPVNTRAAILEAETLVRTFQEYGEKYAEFHTTYEPIRGEALPKIKQTLAKWVQAADALALKNKSTEATSQLASLFEPLRALEAFQGELKSIDKPYESARSKAFEPQKTTLATFYDAAVSIAELATDSSTAATEFAAAKNAIIALKPVLTAADSYAAERKRLETLHGIARAKAPAKVQTTVDGFLSAAIEIADNVNDVEAAAGEFGKAKQALGVLEPVCTAAGAYGDELTRVNGLLTPTLKLVDHRQQQWLQDRLDTATKQAEDVVDVATAASEFADAKQKLTDLGIAIGQARSYTDELRKVERQLLILEQMALPGQEDEAKRGALEPASRLSLVYDEAIKGEFAKAEVAVVKLGQDLAAAVAKRKEDVKSHLNTLLPTDGGTEDIAVRKSFDLLVQTDEGADALFDLCIAFGTNKLATMLKNFDGELNTPPHDQKDPDKKELVKSLIAFSKSAGPGGIKELSVRLGGWEETEDANARNTAVDTGSKRIGEMLAAGLNGKVLGDVYEKFDGKYQDLAKLTKTACRNNAKVFKALLGGNAETLVAINDQFGQNPTELTDLGAFIADGFGGNGPVLETVIVKCCEPLATKDMDPEALKDPRQVAVAQVQQLVALKTAFPQTDRAKLEFMSDGFGTYSRDDKKTPKRYVKGEPKCGDSMRRLMLDHFKGDFAKLKDPFYREIDSCLPDGVNAATNAQKKKMFEEAPTFSGKPYSAPKQPSDRKGCASADLQHACERHQRSVQTMKPTALYDESDPNQSHRKTTSLWPDEMTEQEVSDALQEALNLLSTAGHVPTADTFNNNGTTYIKVDGTNPPNWAAVTLASGVTVRLGFNYSSPNITIDQFFPTGGTDIISLSHREMHAVRRSIGMPKTT